MGRIKKVIHAFTMMNTKLFSRDIGEGGREWRKKSCVYQLPSKPLNYTFSKKWTWILAPKLNYMYTEERTTLDFICNKYARPLDLTCCKYVTSVELGKSNNIASSSFRPFDAVITYMHADSSLQPTHVRVWAWVPACAGVGDGGGQRLGHSMH